VKAAGAGIRQPAGRHEQFLAHPFRAVAERFYPENDFEPLIGANRR
jgi:hypothetical protein